MKTTTGIIILICAYLLLIPGVTKPMLTLTGTVDKAEMANLGKELIANHPDIPPFLAIAAARLMDGVVVEGKIQAYEKPEAYSARLKTSPIRKTI